MGITYRWTEQVKELDREDWEHCYEPSNVLTSYSLQLALERAELVDGFHYLSLYFNNKLIAIISCFTFRYSLTDLAPIYLQKTVAVLRKLFPKLLKPRLFVVGSPIATCTHTLGIVLPPDHPDYKHLVQVVEREINKKAAELKIGLLCIKEFDKRLNHHLKLIFESDFVVCRSPDTTYIYTAPVAGLNYTDNMHSRYRRVLKNRKKAFVDAGLRWIVIDDFGPHVDKLHHLYCNVLQRSRTKFECLTPAFFHAVNEELKDHSKVLLCLDGARIVAFELLLKGRNLHPLYLGIDYSYRDSSALYFNCLYRVIEEAQYQQHQFIELGQTSYEAKFSVGAISSSLFFYIKHSNPLYNKLIHRFKEQIFPTPQLPPLRNVFKFNNEYLSALKSAGVL